MLTCDAIEGICRTSNEKAPVHVQPSSAQALTTIRYVGDPMCSWCWGISPTLSDIKNFCDQSGLNFAVTVGGLRAGGGDPWNAVFKEFLRAEWQHIALVTGQPFGFSLLELPHFEYDTEPACRATVTVQLMFRSKALKTDKSLEFFSAIQKKFYVHGRDPKDIEFYEDICQHLDIDFKLFESLYDSNDAKKATNQEFSRCRRLGVRAFPTLLLEREDKLYVLGVGNMRTSEVFEKITQETGLNPSKFSVKLADEK